MIHSAVTLPQYTHHLFMQDNAVIQWCCKGKNFDTWAISSTGRRENIVQIYVICCALEGVDAIQTYGIGCGNIDDVMLVLARASLSSCRLNTKIYAYK